MLTRLQLLNYQSHKKTDLKLGQFTVIVGPSSSGKTSIIRALRLVAQNARGTSYVRNGAKLARVTVSSAQFEGDPSDAQIHVAVERGKNTSAYELTLPGDTDTQLFTKCGTSTPEMIRAALDFGDGELWLANQFDRPFLLDETGSQIARVLGELTNVTVIYAAVRELNRRASQSKQTHASLSVELDIIKTKIRDYVDLPAQLSACGNAEALLVSAQALEERRIALFGGLLAIGGARDRLAASRAIVRPIPDITKLNELADLRTRLSVLISGLKDSQIRRNSIILNTIPDLSLLLSLTEKRITLFNLLQEIDKFSSRAVESRGVIARVGEKQAQVRAQLGTVLTEVGECPVCGADSQYAQTAHVGH